jgi:glucuronyl/N-acetylglucosaminyl transferase EXT2
LIYKNRELKDQSAEAALFDAMRFNCIPVLIANEWILPFSEIIDWNLISIQIDVHNLKILPQMLDSLSQEKLKFMFNQLELVYSTYFSSIRAITLTILDIISFRVYPAFKLPYEFYNFRVKSYNKSPFILPYKPNSKLGFTLIVVSYDPQFYRDTMSLVRSSSLLEASQASKIIVLWYENVLKLSDLSDEKPSQSQKRVVFKTMNMHGSMQSRFFPLKEIETEAVMIVDEFALSKMDPNDFDTMFNAWLRIPKALVVLKLFENLNDDMSPFIYNSYLNRYFHGGSQKLNEVNFNCENKQFMRMFVNLTNNVVRVTPKNVKARDLSEKIESFSRINCDDYLL